MAGEGYVREKGRWSNNWKLHSSTQPCTTESAPTVVVTEKPTPVTLSAANVPDELLSAALFSACAPGTPGAAVSPAQCVAEEPMPFALKGETSGFSSDKG